MTAQRDAVIVGAGHNGLVAAFYLARAGLGVEVLEAQDQVGGACVTEELIPGFRFSTCANVVCWLRPEVVADLGLDRRGLEFSSPGERIYHCWEVMVQLFSPECGFVWWGDHDKMKAAIASVSAHDAEAWDEWNAFWSKASRIFAPFIMRRPPTFAEIYARASQLGLEEILTAVLTNSIAGLTDQFFKSGVLRNHIRSPIDLGSADDSGTGLAAALAEAVAEPPGAMRPPRGFVRGGMGRRRCSHRRPQRVAFAMSICRMSVDMQDEYWSCHVRPFPTNLVIESSAPSVSPLIHQQRRRGG